MLVAVLPDTTPVVVVATTVIRVGSGWTEEPAERLSACYGLPAVVGSAVLDIPVTPALSGTATDGDPETDRTVVSKRAQLHTEEIPLVNSDGHWRAQ